MFKILTPLLSNAFIAGLAPGPVVFEPIPPTALTLRSITGISFSYSNALMKVLKIPEEKKLQDLDEKLYVLLNS